MVAGLRIRRIGRCALMELRIMPVSIWTGTRIMVRAAAALMMMLRRRWRRRVMMSAPVMMLRRRNRRRNRWLAVITMLCRWVIVR